MSKNKGPRTTGKNIRRNYASILISASFFFLLGLYVILVITLNPTPAYEDLNDAVITVDHIKTHSSGKGSRYDALTSTDGVRYRLSGDCNFSTLKERLPKGTEIVIKWYKKDTLMLEKHFIAEIYLDGEQLSAYTNNNKVGTIFACVSGGILFAIGIGCLIFYDRTVKVEIQKLPKRHRD